MVNGEGPIPAGRLATFFETGNTESLARLADYVGVELTWEGLRTWIREQRQKLPEEFHDGGYFSIDHARHLVARQAGFDNWNALAASFLNDQEDKQNSASCSQHDVDTS